MTKNLNKFIFATYTPYGECVWLWRFNLFWDRGFNRVELTAGLLGFGILANLSYKREPLEFAPFDVI